MFFGTFQPVRKIQYKMRHNRGIGKDFLGYLTYFFYSFHRQKRWPKPTLQRNKGHCSIKIEFASDLLSFLYFIISNGGSLFFLVCLFCLLKWSQQFHRQSWARMLRHKLEAGTYSFPGSKMISLPSIVSSAFICLFLFIRPY